MWERLYGYNASNETVRQHFYSITLFGGPNILMTAAYTELACNRHACPLAMLVCSSLHLMEH